MSEYRIGIVASPCSGTHYVREVLNGCGLRIGAEAGPERDGQAAWTAAVSEHRFQTVLHQVRRPVLAVSGISIFAARQSFRDEVSEWVNIAWNDDVVRWSVEFWMQWNL